jgi:hypothetical protein
MGHGFDDQGAKSDAQGVLRDWWSEADVAAFGELVDKLAAQYDQYEPLEGITVNGRLTSGENIGDNGGLQVAHYAYGISRNGEAAPELDEEMIMLKNDTLLGGKPITIFDDPPPIFVNGSLDKANDILRDLAKFYNVTLEGNESQVDIIRNGDNVSLSVRNIPKMNSSQIDAHFELKSVPSELLNFIHAALVRSNVSYSLQYLANTTIKSVSQDFRMFLDINSIYDTGWDYVGIFDWNSTTDVWNYTLNQFGPINPQLYRPLIPETRITSANLSQYLPIQENFIDHKINLSDLNYPLDFRILFQMNNKIATTADVHCEFYDRTDLIAFPPPKVYLDTNPASLDLLPGETGKILLTVNSSTDLDGYVHFELENDPAQSGLEIIGGPSPDDVFLPPRGLATSELRIRPISAEVPTVVLRPLANVSFPTSLSIGLYGNETSALTHLEIYGGIPIAVNQPLGPIEQIGEGLDNGAVFLSKASGIITTIGIIATGILGFLAFLRKLSRGKSRAEPERRSPI